MNKRSIRMKDRIDQPVLLLSGAKIADIKHVTRCTRESDGRVIEVGRADGSRVWRHVRDSVWRPFNIYSTR